MKLVAPAGKELFQCDFCQKTFSNNDDLNEHLRIHTGEKPFECQVCRKEFSQSSILLRHMRVFTRGKPFKYRWYRKLYPGSALNGHAWRLTDLNRKFQSSLKKSSKIGQDNSNRESAKRDKNSVTDTYLKHESVLIAIEALLALSTEDIGSRQVQSPPA